MAKLIKPKDIFVEFLRTVYKEPARTGLSKRHTSVTNESHSPGNGDTEITVTNTKLLCVNTVKVNGTTKTKYLDYYVDLRNNKVIFVSSFAGTETVLISYDYNTNGISWINPSNPERDNTSSLSRTDYPRITVSEINHSSDFLGFNSNNQNDIVLLQIDIATKDRLKASDYVRVKNDGSTETISESSMNSDLIDVLGLGIRNAIKRNWRDYKHIFYLSKNPFKGTIPLSIDNDVGIFRKIIDIEIKGFDLGESS